MSFCIIIPRNQAWLAAGWCPSQWLRGEKHCKEKISTSIVFIIVFSLRFTTSFLHMQITCCSRNTITAEKNPRLDLEHVAHKKMTTVQTQRQKQKRGAEKACVCVIGGAGVWGKHNWREKAFERTHSVFGCSDTKFYSEPVCGSNTSGWATPILEALCSVK